MDSAIVIAKERVRAAGLEVAEPAFACHSCAKTEQMKTIDTGCMRKMFFITFKNMVRECEHAAHRIDCWVHTDTMDFAIVKAKDRLRSTGWIVDEPASARQRYHGPHYKRALYEPTGFLMMINGRLMIEGQPIRKQWWQFW
jgi:hypothetical protein